MKTLMIVAAVVLASATASAQTRLPGDQPAGGQLIVEKIEHGWLFVPDVRATDLDGRTGALTGGYAGRIHDRSLVFGGGGYWLTNREDDFKLAYGGAVVQWLVGARRPIGFGLRALVGGGSATLPLALGDLVNVSPRDRRHGSIARFGGQALDPDQTVAVRDDFVVVEPQLDVLWNLSPRYRISFGVGYRAVGWAPYLGSQLNGVSGSIAFQVGGGS